MTKFDWDKDNIAHIARHGVLPHEAEVAYDSNPLFLGYSVEEGEERHREIGETNNGRILVVVSTMRGEFVRIVTATSRAEHCATRFSHTGSTNSMEKRIIPKFASEAEEAQWWFDNQEELDKDFAQALAEGRLQRRTWSRPPAAVPTTTIRLDPADIEMARAQAEKKGLKYQTYLKMVIHEALMKEAKAS
jgi:uncharacterized DUF497 family protein/predicted DNA binding CopG/RHH family protein